MKKLLAVAAMFSFVACGSSLCKTNQTRTNDFKKKHAACADFIAQVPTYSDASVKACETASSACTADDKKKIEDTAACVEAIAACTTETQVAFGTALTACNTKREGISTACNAAFAP